MSDFKELVKGYIGVINEGGYMPKGRYIPKVDEKEKADGCDFSAYFGNSTKYEKKYIDKIQAKFWYSKLYGADKNFYNDPDLKKEFKLIDFSKDQPVAIYTDKGVKHIVPFILTKQGKIKWMVDCDYDINDKAVPDYIRNILK
jgi:hypothetical protein